MFCFTLIYLIIFQFFFQTSVGWPEKKRARHLVAPGNFGSLRQLSNGDSARRISEKHVRKGWFNH